MSALLLIAVLLGAWELYADVGLAEHRHDREQRRLANCASPDDADPSAGRHVQVDAVEDTPALEYAQDTTSGHAGDRRFD